MSANFFITRSTLNASASQLVVSARTGRKELHIERLMGGPNTGYYGPTSAVTTSTGKASEPGPILNFTGAVYGICDVGTIDVQVWEIF